MSRNRLPVWKEGREERGWRTLGNSQLEERHGGLRSSCCSPPPQFSSRGLGFPSPSRHATMPVTSGIRPPSNALSQEHYLP